MNTNRAYYTRTIHKTVIDSVYLGEERRLHIFLPPDYDELASYPVVYCQDGEQFFNLGRVATHATRLILDGLLRPVIIVGVHVNLSRRSDDYDPAGTRFDAYCKFMINEVLPYIEKRYAVGKNADDRLAAGSSLGAAVSLRLALDNPELFGGVIAFSGAYRSAAAFTEPQLGDDGRDRLRVFMLAGEQETAVEVASGVYNFLEMSRSMQKWLASRRADVYYVERPGGHTWGLWQQYVPDALCHFYGL